VEAQGQMFTPQAIGFVDSSYKDSAAIPKGLRTKHDAEGILRVLPEFELGLTDIEGFSHLMVIWAFDRSHGFDLLGTPPFDNRPHGVFATRSPRRPNPIGLTVVELLRRENGLSTFEALTCSMEHPSSISSPTYPASRLRRCVADGSQRLKAGQVNALCLQRRTSLLWMPAGNLHRRRLSLFNSKLYAESSSRAISETWLPQPRCLRVLPFPSPSCHSIDESQPHFSGPAVDGRLPASGAVLLHVWRRALQHSSSGLQSPNVASSRRR
jgi:tRNA (adenine37-N6)-methyltransferase